MSKMRLAVDTPKGVAQAADMVAELVRRGIVFDATQDGAWLVLTFNGSH